MDRIGFCPVCGNGMMVPEDCIDTRFMLCEQCELVAMRIRRNWGTRASSLVPQGSILAERTNEVVDLLIALRKRLR